MRRGEERRPSAWDRRARWLLSVCVALVLLLLAADAFATEPSDQALTRTAIDASAYSVAEHYRTTHSLPASLAPLRRRRRDRDTTRDGWGHALSYRKDDARAFTITSLGADGSAGGRGDDADIAIRYRIGASGWEEEIPTP